MPRVTVGPPFKSTGLFLSLCDEWNPGCLNPCFWDYHCSSKMETCRHGFACKIKDLILVEWGLWIWLCGYIPTVLADNLAKCQLVYNLYEAAFMWNQVDSKRQTAGDTLLTAREKTNSLTEWKDGKIKHPWQCVAAVMMYGIQKME